ncbi:MAG: GNAT family N-acetyltransferase [Actinomycetota bacterium]
MLRVRTVKDIDDFLGAPDDPDGYADEIAQVWESGASRPDWCFVAEDRGSLIGRVGFLVEPTTSDPAWLGSLPSHELHPFGLHLDWEGGPVPAGQHLFTHAAHALGGQVPDLLEMRIYSEIHAHADRRCELLETLGFDLFTEKRGFSWTDGGDIVEVPDRLTFQPVSVVGIEVYRAVMARCGGGTLDRNDRYYWDGCGARNWAEQMTQYLIDGDEPMWLIGYTDGEPVGYVAVVSDESFGSTIGHIGVVPEHRGNGYINDLILAGTAAAQAAGNSKMLSDVDVVNEPMIMAMLRAGHNETTRPWHVWAYRTALSKLAVVSP